MTWQTTLSPALRTTSAETQNGPHGVGTDTPKPAHEPGFFGSDTCTRVLTAGTSTGAVFAGPAGGRAVELGRVTRATGTANEACGATGSAPPYAR